MEINTPLTGFFFVFFARVAGTNSMIANCDTILYIEEVGHQFYRLILVLIANATASPVRKISPSR